MKIVITGKNGLLSRTLQDLDSSLIGLSSEEYDISSPSIIEKLVHLNPDVILHAGAETNSDKINKNPTDAIRTNIIGTAYISDFCIQNNKRIVYVSSDYVYGGKLGNYKETDPVFPYNNYAWSKLGGECSVILVPNHTIIRTSFGSTTFPYNVAFSNLITSKDYVDVIAPKILNVCKSSVQGIINIGTEPKTVYEYASTRNTVAAYELPTPLNFSLDITKYEQSFNN